MADQQGDRIADGWVYVNEYFYYAVYHQLEDNRYVICVEKNEGHSLVVPSVELGMHAPDTQDAYDVAGKD